MADLFAAHQSGLDSPASGAFAVTPSDATVFAQPTRSLYVGSTGDVAVVMVDGTSVTFSTVPSGTTIRIRTSKVKSTGTTASGIVGMY